MEDAFYSIVSKVSFHKVRCSVRGGDKTQRIMVSVPRMRGNTPVERLMLWTTGLRKLWRTQISKCGLLSFNHQQTKSFLYRRHRHQMISSHSCPLYLSFYPIVLPHARCANRLADALREQLFQLNIGNQSGFSCRTLSRRSSRLPRGEI